MALSPFSATWRNDVAKLLASIQASIATFVVGPASSTNNNIALFSGTTGKLLKDSGVPYASGTFIPTVAFATPGTSSFSYASQAGFYTRFGDIVHVESQVTFTPTIGTGSGNIRLLGLPFTVNVSTAPAGNISNMNSAFTWSAGRTMAVAVGEGGSTFCTIRQLGSGVNSTIMTTANLTGGSSHSVFYTLTYRV